MPADGLIASRAGRRRSTAATDCEGRYGDDRREASPRKIDLESARARAIALGALAAATTRHPRWQGQEELHAHMAKTLTHAPPDPRDSPESLASYALSTIECKRSIDSVWH
jgi:hypothetical protein